MTATEVYPFTHHQIALFSGRAGDVLSQATMWTSSSGLLISSCFHLHREKTIININVGEL
jgi:hypothetical protein